MKKRLLSILLVCVMLIGLLPTVAFAMPDGTPITEATTISEGGTYYLANDITGQIKVTAGDVTIDLNGKTLSIEGSSGMANSSALYITGGNVTVTGEGTIKSTTNTANGCAVYLGGDTGEVSLTLNGGTYEQTGSSACPLNLVGNVTINEGVTVNGGNQGNISGGGVLTVNGGSFDGGIVWQGTAYLNGGSFKNVSCIGTLRIHGGSYSWDPTEYLYYANASENAGTWTATATQEPPVGDYAAMIGSANYSTIAEAIAAVKDGETITLLKSVEDAANFADVTAVSRFSGFLTSDTYSERYYSASYKAGFGDEEEGKAELAALYQEIWANEQETLGIKSVTLDLAGHSIGGIAVAGYKLTIDDSSVGKTGMVAYNEDIDAALAVMMLSEVTVSGGTYDGVFVYEDTTGFSPFGITTLTVNDGTFTSSEEITMISVQSAKCIINGGSIVANGEYPILVDEGGTLEINGGWFTGYHYYWTYPSVTEWDRMFQAFGENTIVLKGGYYQYDKFAGGENGNIEAAMSTLVAVGYEWVENTDSETKTTYPYMVKAPVYVAKIGETEYTTLAAAIEAATEAATEASATADNPTIVELYPGEVQNGGLTLSNVVLNHVVFRGASDGTSTWKDCQINFQSGTGAVWDDVKFENIIFDNSGITFSTNSTPQKNLTADGCTFKNLNRSGNIAGMHFNATCENFTFTNNIFDTSAGSSVAAVNGNAFTGNLTVTGNTFKNSCWRPLQLQIDSDDSIADVVVIQNNLFVDNASGVQIVGNGADTDGGSIAVTDNAFVDGKTVWFNSVRNTNPIDVSRNYWKNGAKPTVGTDYGPSGCTPVISCKGYATKYETNGSGRGATVSSFGGAVAKIGGKQYFSLADAIAGANGGTEEQPVVIELLKDIVLTSSVDINKNNVVIDGKKSDTENYTISADPDKADWQKYKINGSGADSDSVKFGRINLISVTGQNVTVKNVTVDVKDYRGISCMTTVGGKDVTYENVTYEGRGSAHYYGYGNGGGTITFKDCKVNTKGYGFHLAQEDVTQDKVVIDGCAVHGWNSFGTCESVTAKDSTFYGADDTGKNGLLAKFRPYCPTTITNCKFSEDYLDAGDFCGIDSGADTTVALNGCSVIKNDGSASERKVYELINYKDNDASKATIFAIDAEGNVNGYTAGTFVTKTGKITLAPKYKLATVTTNVYQVVPFDKVAIPVGQNFVYDSKSHTGVKVNAAYTLTGNASAIDVGTYTATATLEAGYQWADGTTEAKSVTWEILKQSQSAPTKGEGYTIEGTTLKAASGYEILISGTNAPTQNNPTTAAVTITAGQTYFVRKAEVQDQKYASPYTAIDTTVSVAAIASPASMGTVSIAGVTNGKCQIGTEVTATATAKSGYEFVEWRNAAGNKINDAGASYRFTANVSATLTAVFKVRDKVVATLPTVTNYEYDNKEYTGVTGNVTCTLTGTTKATTVGTYTATAKLAQGYDVWPDGTTADKTFTWSITPKTQDAPTGLTTSTDELAIYGVTAAMEYKLSTDPGTEYKDVTADEETAGKAIVSMPGTYYVRMAATNTALASKITVVVVKEPTISAVTIQPADLDTTSALFTGAAEPYDADRITNVGFAYKTKTEDDWTSVEATEGASFSKKVETQTLTQDTDYIVRAFVTYTTDGKSTTAYGKEIAFHTRKAPEQSVAIGEITAGATVEGTVAKKVIISVEEGNDVIASAISAEAISAGSTFKTTFEKLPDGNYNVVVRTENGEFTETRMVTIENGATVDTMFTIPVGKLATVVDVKTVETPKVAVEGLAEMLTDTDKNAAAVGTKNVEIKLEAQKEATTATDSEVPTDTTAYAVAQIEKLIPEATATVEEKIETVLDLSLIKTTTELENDEVKSVEVKDIGSENDKVIEVAVPYETAGKTLKVYRYHDGVAEELTLLSSRPSANFIDGTYFVGDGYVFIYASGFSTYAISYEETKTVTGGGGGGVTTYAITGADTVNGKLTVDKKTASSGSTVTITVTPDKGFTLETLTVTDKNGKEIEVKNLGNNKYSFKMPSGKVTVKATFMEDNTMLNFFVDVKSTDYFYDAVLWAAENDITKGTDAVHFSPNMGTTRAQVVTFLWRAAGCPEPKGDAGKFVDVPANEYYAKAVAWAIEQVITKGTSETTFSPDVVCTRGQIVTFLARFAGVADEAAGYTHGFTDVKATDYFNNAVAWAKDNKVTEGTSATTFSPNTDCTRAQVVTFLYRWMVK